MVDAYNEFADEVRKFIVNDQQLIYKIADAFEISQTTVHRWANGIANPHPRMKRLVLEWIKAMFRTRYVYDRNRDQGVHDMGFKPAIGKTIINTEGRIIVIGDPHGCYDECIDMLDLLKVSTKDTVVFAGDMVDRGPDNDKCMDLAMSHEAILGNHEDRHLRYVLQEEREGFLDPSRLPPTHAHTRSQLRPVHYEYMKTLPHFIRFPQYKHAVVHGGTWPGISLEEQNVELLIRMQYINPVKSKKTFWANKRPVNSKENELEVMYDDSFKFWTHLWDGDERIIFGHSVLNMPLETEKVVGIDGGCVFGRELWAFVLPDMKIYRVPSRNPQDEFGRKIFMITDTVGTY